MVKENLFVKLLRTQDQEDLRNLQEIQRVAWAGMADLEIMPVHAMVSIIAVGGQIIMLFVDKTAIGFSIGMPTFSIGTEKVLYSLMVGIRPDYQSRGFGQYLKLAQRDYALESGYTRIDWTFSPMLTRNAYLNISKLRAKCKTFFANRYGIIDSKLYGKVPTDRLEVQWDLQGDKQARCHHAIGSETQDILVSFERRPKVQPELFAEGKARGQFGLSVPCNFSEITAYNPKLAIEWQTCFSMVAQEVLAPNGRWSITDVMPPNNGFCKYIFRKTTD